MTVKQYHFRNGLVLAISDTTLKKMIDSGEVDTDLISTEPIIGRGTFLLEFERVDEKKTGFFLGNWLSEKHLNKGIPHDWIGAHTVDSASNAVAGVDNLKIVAEGTTSHEIIAERCDAHKANTASGEASGTSAHKVCLHPNARDTMERLHETFGRVHRSKHRRDEIKTVHTEHRRTKYPKIMLSVVTRWGSRHKEAKTANALQKDLDMALKRMIRVGGCDEDLFKKHDKEGTLPSLFIQPDHWNFLQQYEGALLPLVDFLTFAQSVFPVAHWELFESQPCLERLSLPFFLTYANMSTRTGDKFAPDLTVKEMSVCCSDPDYFWVNNAEGDSYITNYSNMEQLDTLDDIRLVRRIAFRKFAERVSSVPVIIFLYIYIIQLTIFFITLYFDQLGYVNRINTVDGRSVAELHQDIASDLHVGLENVEKLPVLKITAALLNPLLQNAIRMTVAGMCTEVQAQNGMAHLREMFKEYYEGIMEVEVDVPDTVSMPMRRNNYDVDESFKRKSIKTPLEMADAELSLFQYHNNEVFQPTMKAYKCIGLINDEGKPQKPVYEIGPVVSRGRNFKDTFNHADYVTKSGDYDLCRMFTDCKQFYPAGEAIFNGKLAYHVTTEVDCESLFSQAGYVAEPRRSQTDVRTYERLVVGKHRMHRMHIRNEDIKKLYLERFNNNDWDEKEERDDQEFLQLEGEIWKKMFPEYANIEGEEEGGDDNECEEENIVDDNVDDDKESDEDADGEEDEGVDLFGEDSDTDNVNHETLKLPGATSDGDEGGEESLSGVESVHEESV